ncbi:hypothetical protein BGZ63DRAFT_366511 [Mariannaea sp. PMI_226]|nr:hypothetical protein BGZ63DRAFT_366511 [Mariannaea sp. PMI_226]
MSSEKNPAPHYGLLPTESQAYPPPPQSQNPQDPQNPHHSTEQQYPPPPAAQQYFPPPPPHDSTPPPPQQYFPPPPPHDSAPHDSAPHDLAPPYEQGGFTLPVSEKPHATQSRPVQQGEYPASGSENFPPPPPGPPPHPNPLSSHPVDQTSQQHETSEQYTIPQYNPADPVFAPPPHLQPHTTAPEAVPEAAPAISGTSSTEQHQKKHGWSERFSNLGIKAAAPINSLAHMLGSQSFLPETLDKECEKAASILRTFCKKGVYADPGSGQPPTSTDPKATETNDDIIDPTKQKPKNRVIVTIPPKVISKAVGLAIFTTLRAGFNVSGATGSGILIARLPDGSWGPPSGIQVHSVGGGFSIGLDIYDCVCVINSREALAAFTKTRVGLGTDLAVVAGPYGAGGAVEFGTAVEGRQGRKQGEHEQGEKEEQKQQQAAATSATTQTPHTNQSLKPEKQADKTARHRRSLSASAFKPVFSYVKSRGFYAGIQIDGTVVVERKDANAAFYGQRVPVDSILKGEVPAQGPAGQWPTGARGLWETLKGAEAGMKSDGKQPKGKETAPVAAPVAAGQTTTTTTTTGVNDGLPAYVDDGVQRPGDYKYR